MYEGPHSDWLRDVLERLPNMQSLIVNGLPFFDHAALLTLRHRSPLCKSPRLSNAPPMFPALRLLDAQKCSNATPSGLAEALRHFPGLLYVNLSSTVAARAPAVLAVLGSLPNLQTLKLENIGLKDEDIQVLTAKLALRIRSLDLRNNLLTDTSVRLLLAKCFKIVHDPPPDQPSNFTESGLWPSRMDAAYIGDVLRHTQDEELDRYLRKRLTSELVDRLAIEDTQPSGVTHFYISGNRLTAEGILALLRSTNLNVLDAGDVARELPEMTGLGSPPDYGTWESLLLPGAEKLIPVIAAASRDLTYLRINHAILTECAPASCTAPPPLSATPPPPSVPELPAPANPSRINLPLRPEMSGDSTPRTELDSGVPVTNREADTTRAELDGNYTRAELSGGPVFHELDTIPAIPELPGDTVRLSRRFELPGDTVRLSRRFELAGSAPQLYVSDAEDNLYSDPSEWSWNSTLSERHTVSTVDDDGDEGSSVIINVLGGGLTDEASRMNGTSSRVPLQRKPSASEKELPYSAPTDEWSWDSSKSEKLDVSTRDQEHKNMPSVSETTSLPEAVSRSNTLDAPMRRFTSQSSTHAISPIDGDGGSHDSSLILNDSGHNPPPSNGPLNGTSTLSPIVSRTPSTQGTTKSTTPPPGHPHLHQRTYSSIINERRARVAHNSLYPTLLRPSMLPHLKTLILTSLPPTSSTLTPSDRLKNYISACAEEASLASLQAHLGYAMPPGQRGRLQAQREYARSIFALERIVLEIAPSDDLGTSDGGSGGQHQQRRKQKKQAPWRKYPTKSSTEDADSERFWEAAQYDFSFFGDEECGQPALGALSQSPNSSLLSPVAPNRRFLPAAAGLMVVGEEEGRVDREVLSARHDRASSLLHPDVDGGFGGAEQTLPQRQSYDLVKEIAKFRRERKSAYETAVRAAQQGKGKVGPGLGMGMGLGLGQEVVSGYWEGEVKVVRVVGGV